MLDGCILFLNIYWRKEEVFAEFLVEKPEGKVHFEDPGVDGSICFRLNLAKGQWECMENVQIFPEEYNPWNFM